MKSISELVIGKQWDIVNQRLLHQSFNKMLSNSGEKRNSREYWEEQLSEYWDSGLTIQEYSDLKDLPYETVRRWIRVLKKERAPEAASLKLVELISQQ